MKKIPTLFDRDWDSQAKNVIPVLTPGCENVAKGWGMPTRKWDGTACLLRRAGESVVIYKRFDAKHGKTPPEGFQPAQPDPDPETGHWPGWVACSPTDPADRYHIEAVAYYPGDEPIPAARDEWTYELCGPKVNGNPERLDGHRLIRHGADSLRALPPAPGADPGPIALRLWFEDLRAYLEQQDIEGIVWWSSAGEPMAKLKKRDFGLARRPAVEGVSHA